MKCPVCQSPLDAHTDHDCLLPLLNRIKALEKIATLASARVFGEPSLDDHDELRKALQAAGFTR